MVPKYFVHRLRLPRRVAFRKRSSRAAKCRE